MITPDQLQSPMPQQSIQQTPTLKGLFTRFYNKKIFFALGIFFILLVPLIFVLVMTQKSSDVLLATVGDKKIYKSTVEDTAREFYTPTAIDKKALKNSYDITVERALLDYEAATENITLSEKEIEEKAKNMYSIQSPSINENYYNAAKYTLIKERILAKNILSKEAYVISFWIPPFTYTQKPIYAEQREEGEQALNDAEQRFNNNDEPLTIAMDIFDTYPSLQNILLLNGYKIKNTRNRVVFEKPRLFTFEKELLKELDDPEFYDALLETEPGSVKKVIKSDASGGTVIKVTSQNLGKYISIKQLLEERKKQLVTVHQTL